MTLEMIACRNLLRRKGKAAFILAGLLIGVCTVVTIISLVDAMSSDITQKLEKYGANILIVPRTENLTLTYGGLSLGGVSFEMEEIRQQELQHIRTIKNKANLAAVGPLVLGAVEVDARKVLLAGVDFGAARILKPWWRVNGNLPDTQSVILGAETARILNLSTGGTLMLKDKPFMVSGILQPTGSQDDQLIFSQLVTAQSLLNKTDKISMVEVAALCGDCPVSDMVKQISAVLPGAKVMAIQQVVKSRMQTLAHFKKLAYAVSAVVLLVGSLVVLVTMMGSVRERTEEIGVFRAIGFRKSHVMRIIFTEAGIIASLAGLCGYVLAWGATKIAVGFFTESQTVAVPLNPELAAGTLAASILIGLAAGAYPAFMAARLDPNDALRAL